MKRYWYILHLILKGAPSTYNLGIIFMLERYIGNGLDIDAINSKGETALHLAKDTVIAEKLLSLNANPNIADREGNTPKIMEKVSSDYKMATGIKRPAPLIFSSVRPKEQVIEADLTVERPKKTD